MNKDIFAGNWQQLKGEVQRNWGKLTNDDLDIIEGNRKKLAGKLQEAYGMAREDADRQISDWERNFDDRAAH